MSKYVSSSDLKQKADWEGGILELIFGYGLSAKDLPDDLPGDIRTAFYILISAGTWVDLINEYFEGTPNMEDWG